MKLKIVPITLKASNEFVAKHHRHHKPVTGHKYSVAVADETGVRGVAIVSRPTARMSDDGLTLEVTRLATDGVENGCSMLYRAAWRIASAFGYSRLITYTLASEPGSSLRGAGFHCLGQRGGGSWSRPSREREDKHPLELKLGWEISA
jgi:hypothetical protein